MTVADDLRAARKLIERPECWTKETEARSDDGTEVGATNDYAVCWCPLGALERTCGGWNDRFYAAQRALDRSLPGHARRGEVWEYNDRRGRKHADILALFDRAIAAAEERA